MVIQPCDNTKPLNGSKPLSFAGMSNSIPNANNKINKKTLSLGQGLVISFIKIYLPEVDGVLEVAPVCGCTPGA